MVGIFLLIFREKRDKLKKIICLILLCICLTGCADSNSTETRDEIRYSYENADAVITYIDMRKWFAYVPRWQWEIKAEYDGLTYEEDDYASGMMNEPSFADSQKGDSVTVEVTEKYVNGKLVDRYISGIE